MLSINLHTILIWLTAIIIGSLSVVMYVGNHKLSTRVFAYTIGIVTVWTACVAFFSQIQDYFLAGLGVRIIFFLGQVVAAGLLYTLIVFPDDERPNAAIPFILGVVLAGFFYLIFFTQAVVVQPIAMPGAEWAWQSGQFFFLWQAFQFICFITSICILYSKHKKASGQNLRRNLAYMMTAVVIGTVVPTVFNNILPGFGYFGLTWIGPLTGIVWVSILAYSIGKYHQMNLRIAVTELLTLGMIIVSFANIFLDESFGTFGRVVTFIAFLVLGLYLIRGALKEVEQREQLKELNDNLQEKVSEQTKEIRASYEVERTARLELESLNEAKDQFIMVTQHHLRTPVTSLKWQLESLLEDKSLPSSPALKEGLANMDESVATLGKMIDGFLNISAWKAGKNILNKLPADFHAIVDGVLKELQNDIVLKHIKVEHQEASKGWPTLNIDKNKMREAVFIIIENAVRYNIQGGTILINAVSALNQFQLIIENTGIRLSIQDEKKIFSETFYRSEEAKTANPTGMGMGLSMARAIVEAHGGTIEIVPRDSGEGAKVTITLPIA
jgi:signal transduction histidine kinase